jgi:hypothetical protein
MQMGFDDSLCAGILFYSLLGLLNVLKHYTDSFHRFCLKRPCAPSSYTNQTIHGISRTNLVLLHAFKLLD